MIRKIGVIYQDLNSLGFLRGLRDRLKCEADLILPPAAIGKTQRLPRKYAKLAWLYYQKKGVDLVVRFTDADGSRWQDVKRKELDVVPPDCRDIWICAIAVNNPEEWLCLDVDYLSRALQIPNEELQNPQHRVGRVKRAVKDAQTSNKRQSDVVARIVRDAPTQVFRQWLQNDALRTFYSDCRAAAARADCETPNELEATPDA